MAEQIIITHDPGETAPDNQNENNRFRLDERHLLQSRYLNLQAAGSMGADSTKGIHLRWFLNGFLGENHLPKGNYALNEKFFNRKDDFVKLYRIPYDAGKRIVRSFSLLQKPDIVNSVQRVWIYRTGDGIFHLRFSDAARYKQILDEGIDPVEHHISFMNAYAGGLLELELRHLLSFALNVHSKVDVQCMIETFSSQSRSDLPPDATIISARKDYSTSAVKEFRIVAENIKLIRFRHMGKASISFDFETYEDILQSGVKNNWLQFIGRFALNLETGKVLKHLEATPGSVDKHWLKYNDSAFVNVKNYHDRWLMDDGLRKGIERYIHLSESDPLATEAYEEQLNPGDKTVMDVSLLSFLNIASTDFHVARMLELGYMDTGKFKESNSFIYLAEYLTEKDPEDYNIPKFSQHLYFSLPTSMRDERLPQELKLLPLQYGLTVSNGTATPLWLTDASGYLPNEQLRYVKIKSVLKNDFQQRISFFHPATEFQSSDFSSPVFIGIENKKESDPDWIRPELSHDVKYKDPSDINETMGIFFSHSSDKPDYLHEIATGGVDVYAAYPINIFSRASAISNIQKTDATVFRKPNTLKAPVNVAVQLIQKEDPLLLSAAAEQVWLGNIDPEKKEIFCRLSFDYNHTHELNYRYGNKVQIFHKKQPPANLSGKIAAVDNADATNPHCIITTGDYTYGSTGEPLVPKVDPATKDFYKGSNLSYNSVNYVIEEIILTAADGSYPKIKLRKNEKRESIADPDNEGEYQLTQLFDGPVATDNKAFLAVENLRTAKNWEESGNSNQLVFEVELGLPSWPGHTESYLDTEGNTKQEIVKGIWDTAEIAASAEQPGMYTITFNSYVLDNHPQYLSPDNTIGTPSVNWYRGFIRVHLKNDAMGTLQRKVLKVEQILELGTGQKLQLIVTDPNYSAAAAENIKEGAAVSVNYHPGYRVYLRKDEHPGVNFTGSYILPQPDEGTRKTIIGLRTVDTATLDAAGKAYLSPMSVPALLSARELREPKKPSQPQGPLFATPPDFFNKASYSFTTEFTQKPWGLVYFRIDINKVLACLYETTTIDGIKRDLPPLKDDLFAVNRWDNLLSFDYSSNSGDFEAFPINAEGTLYTFPKPDRSDIFPASYLKPSDVADKIKDVICSNLLPLTEQPLICAYIKDGNYLPLPLKQKVTDSTGKVLHPSHPDFAQAPMAKKVTDQKILFTDFTLDGNMSSDTGYFYVVRELSNSMQMGEPSKFLGPVQLLNTKAPDVLNVRKMSVQTPNVFNEDKNAVVFEVHTIAASQEVSSVQILRSADIGSGQSTRTMTLVKEILLDGADPAEDYFTVEDDFENDPEIPFGIPLYYKLVGVRRITYKDPDDAERTLLVYSEPTKTFVTNVIDATNPAAPQVEISPGIIASGIIEQLIFKWNKTCYSGSYSLSMLNSKGSWTKLYSIRSNDEAAMTYTYDCNLDEKDADGNTIYYKFKVDVENTSGLINKEAKVLAFGSGEL